MGLRLLLPARKSRKGKDDNEETRYARQEANMVARAEADGHTVVRKVRDTVSSQTMPWERKNLKMWFTDPEKLAQWDALFVETDRLSRADDEGWHYIEHFCIEHGKRIITTEGVQFPPRDDSDRYQWVGLKRRSRTYWEDVKSKHAGARDIIRENRAFFGRPPFGYKITGAKYGKQLVPDESTAPIVRTAYQRIADGQSALQLSRWLATVTGVTGWRMQRTLEMIRRPGYYTGERDGHLFEPLVSEELWTAANNALDGRRQERRGRRVDHAYSGLVYCECGERMYAKRNSTRDYYRCRRGRVGVVLEETCGHGSPHYEAANYAVDELMRRCNLPERIITTTGGDHARQAQLRTLQEAMQSAMKDGRMDEVTKLAAQFQEVQDQEPEPIRTTLKNTGRTYAQVWAEGTLDDRRALLARGDFRITLREDATGWRASLQWEADTSPRSVELHQEAGLELIGTYFDLVRLSPHTSRKVALDEAA